MNKVLAVVTAALALLVTGCGEQGTDAVWQDQLDMQDKARGVEDVLDAASSRRDDQLNEIAE